MVEVIERRQGLAAALQAVRAKGERIGLVPTMGALHEGHRSLVESSASSCAVTVVSVFVNPLQFDDPDDLARYPKTLEADLALAERAGADLCFAPSVEELYPSGPPSVRVDPGPLGGILEGASRPGHLAGVATVVAKLLALVAPDAVFFGEKDFQQLVLVRRLVADLSFPVEVVGCPTVREGDGLARSSRNRRLSGEERAAAVGLYEALLAGRRVLEAGGPAQLAVDAMTKRLGADERLETDYAVVRRAADLSEPAGTDAAEDLRLLAAAWVGATRLIDNLGVGR